MGKQALTWIGIIVVIILGVGGLIALSNNSSSSTPTKSANIPPVSSQDIVQEGSPSAKVTLIEYADFQCPACKFEYPSVKQLMTDFKPTELRVVYRFFPLLQVHQNAMVSAEAGYAAFKQGKFREMEDKLFTTQDNWASLSNQQAADTFLTYAKQLNLNVDQFKKDAQSNQAQKFISDEESAGINAGVNATPTFFVNGQKIDNNPQSYGEFKQIIQNALGSK